jgi:hypothetical protein
VGLVHVADPPARKHQVSAGFSPTIKNYYPIGHGVQRDKLPALNAIGKRFLIDQYLKRE